MATDRFKLGLDWHIRTPTGEVVNLNSPSGAAFVLGLLVELERLKAHGETRRGRKPGPSENK